ncbi:DUF7507 domain-containing protein, partial [Paenarthrobacter nitroguajacolicus]|uniref:DUF7507 domain-containing protein n=1 Tax=Paenarthrobacter nitroguajacolicus TaxID=211146 RepID=UPI003AE26874
PQISIKFLGARRCVEETAAMEFSKSADASGIQNPSAVGDSIVYTFTSKNTGNVTPTNNPHHKSAGRARGQWRIPGRGRKEV